MDNDERGRRRRDAGLGLVVRTDVPEPETDIVFDFTGLQHPALTDLALILTARLHSDPEDRVWVRALPHGTWYLLQALGLDHLFRVYPGPDGDPN
jgi:phosphoglycolate phosphatase-like HAD superfamily hydrolase